MTALVWVAVICGMSSLAITVGRLIADNATHDGAWFLAVILALLAAIAAVVFALLQASNSKTERH